MDILNTSFSTASRARLFGPLLGLTALVLAGSSLAAGSPEAGQAKAATCAACHGMDGNSQNPEWPSIAGQHENYIIKSLKSFKSGERQNVLMSGMAMPLSDEDMADLAAYFSSQKRAGNVADPAVVATGERLYRGGNKDTGVSACLACHGPAGRGNPAAGWPAIAGQHATYTAAQLVAYRSKQRATDGDTQMMRNVAATLTDDEIKAVSSYIQGLR
ncbi:MAG: cytochrome c4 [Gammaproteobacteria bacterium]|nr:cytochrome c4 [Gammaproteobacteria bacterium]MDH5275785.1 cytochrome c4 [Gammaproteobacteria bacterium]